MLAIALLADRQPGQEPERLLRASSSIGLTNGAVYALVALGYTLVYGILELINFAHGDVFMLGGMFTITFVNHFFGLHHGQGACAGPRRPRDRSCLTMAICGALNATIEFLAYRPLRSAPRLAPLITAIGMSASSSRTSRSRGKGPNYVIAPRRAAARRRLQHRHVDYHVEQADRRDHHRARAARRSCGSSRRRGRARRCARPHRTRTRAAMMGINVNRTISFTF